MTSPFTVSTPSKRIPLLVMDAKDGIPAAFALMGTKAKNRVAIRLGGGCKGMNSDDKADMMSFFTSALAGFSGVIWQVRKKDR